MEGASTSRASKEACHGRDSHHPLRDAPYNVRCLGCGNHIAKGVRFNAEKKTIGKYLSTNILSFRFLCHCEDGTSRTSRLTNPHWIEIQTDPKNAEYVVAEGAVRVSDPALLTSEELGVEATLDSEEADKRSANPFYKLEAAALAGPVGAAAAAGGSGHGGESGGESGGGSGRIRLFGQPAGQQKPGQWLESLQGLRDADWEDDYEANRHLRKLHRSKRKSDLMRTAINQVKGIRIPLPEADHPEDIATIEAAPAAHGQAAQGVLGGVPAARPAARRLDLWRLDARSEAGFSFAATTPSSIGAAAARRAGTGAAPTGSAEAPAWDAHHQPSDGAIDATRKKRVHRCYPCRGCGCAIGNTGKLRAAAPLTPHQA